ncbi:aminoglycoside phosphotransferase family protein [Haloplasma contractile]|uniref:Aminoglycoside phosphotransferase protein n=1 Tax=Haloplasma contractile SSD-17B TaxID=1033810 RepID=U2DR18_9MOLU|nr:aminoglycoside phosphotransferase family protein [Haloplasma contractile]ERJ11012.1 Aminoglycoside phosphotransferase protein [Haloplasma contractile SSD-17B]
MESITKTKVTTEHIDRMVRKAFGEEIEVANIEELTEGYFNTAYLVTLNNGDKSVLKVSPSEDVTVMSYEKNLMKTEVFTLESIYSIGGIPVPKVLYYDKNKEIINSDYFFMEFVEGKPLNNVRDQLTSEQYNKISSQLGDYAKKINSLDGNYFGSISRVDKRYNTWSDAFLSMIKELLDDAENMNVLLPCKSNELYSMISGYQEVLNKVKKPSLVHKDMWEGNIFIDPKSSRITGIIDCERALFGDPLIEIVCGFLVENKRFMDTYMGKTELNKDEYIRVTLYKVYLFLLMVIEGAYRQYSDNSIENWAREQLNNTLEVLINIEKSV